MLSSVPGSPCARQASCGITVPLERTTIFTAASARGSALGAMLGAPPAAETGPVRTPSGPNDWHEFNLYLKTIRRLSNSLLSTAAARRRGRIRQKCLTHVVAAAFLFPTPYQTPTVLPASRLQKPQCLLIRPLIGRQKCRLSLYNCRVHDAVQAPHPPRRPGQRRGPPGAAVRLHGTGARITAADGRSDVGRIAANGRSDDGADDHDADRRRGVDRRHLHRRRKTLLPVMDLASRRRRLQSPPSRLPEKAGSVCDGYEPWCVVAGGGGWCDCQQ
mmetsp:Transcript_33592/g.117769  ORF Transcript_33592/g.117769 Transcript_33592/m.117769 type:complete len:274 (+) Transcript_33592:619-1440(+)